MSATGSIPAAQLLLCPVHLSPLFLLQCLALPHPAAVSQLHIYMLHLGCACLKAEWSSQWFRRNTQLCCGSLMSTHLPLLSFCIVPVMPTPCCSLAALKTPPAAPWLPLLYMLQICGFCVMPQGSNQCLEEKYGIDAASLVDRLPYYPLLQV